MRAKKIWELNCRGEIEIETSDVEIDAKDLKQLVFRDQLQEANKKIEEYDCDEDEKEEIMVPVLALCEAFDSDEEGQLKDVNCWYNLYVKKDVVILYGEEVTTTYVLIQS